LFAKILWMIDSRCWSSWAVVLAWHFIDWRQRNVIFSRRSVHWSSRTNEEMAIVVWWQNEVNIRSIFFVVQLALIVALILLYLLHYTKSCSVSTILAWMFLLNEMVYLFFSLFKWLAIGVLLCYCCIAFLFVMYWPKRWWILWLAKCVVSNEPQDFWSEELMHRIKELCKFC